MSTFRELQSRLTWLKNRATILEYLVEHVDSEFRAKAGAPAKRVLMTSEKLPVPEDGLEQMVMDFTEELAETHAKIEEILASPLVEAQQQAAPPAPVQGPVAFIPTTIPMTAPPPLSKKSKKGTNQEEVQS